MRNQTAPCSGRSFGYPKNECGVARSTDRGGFPKRIEAQQSKVIDRPKAAEKRQTRHRRYHAADQVSLDVLERGNSYNSMLSLKQHKARIEENISLGRQADTQDALEELSNAGQTRSS